MWITYNDGTNDRQVGQFAYKHVVTSGQATSGTVTLTLPEATSIDAILLTARTTGNVEKSGLVTTFSDNTVTVANNGSTTPRVS